MRNLFNNIPDNEKHRILEIHKRATSKHYLNEISEIDVEKFDRNNYVQVQNNIWPRWMNFYSYKLTKGVLNDFTRGLEELLTNLGFTVLDCNSGLKLAEKNVEICYSKDVEPLLNQDRIEWIWFECRKKDWEDFDLENQIQSFRISNFPNIGKSPVSSDNKTITQGFIKKKYSDDEWSGGETKPSWFR